MDTKWNGTNHDPGVDLEYYVASQIQEAVEGVEEAPGVVRVKPQKHPRLRAWTGLVVRLAGYRCLPSGDQRLCAGLSDPGGRGRAGLV